MRKAAQAGAKQKERSALGQAKPTGKRDGGRQVGHKPVDATVALRAQRRVTTMTNWSGD